VDDDGGLTQGAVVLLASLLLAPWPWPEAVPLAPPAVPAWAGENWIVFASSIVAGEAADSEGARQVTACTLMNDVRRGWHPWALRDRWSGWKRPGEDDLRAVRLAVSSSICDDYPECLYVGTLSDLQCWRHAGLIGEGAVWVWLDAEGRATACVPVRADDMPGSSLGGLEEGW